MTKLEELRARNRHHRTLPGGLDVTLRYPAPEDLALKAQLPLTILRDLKVKRVKAAENSEAYAPTPEEERAEEAALEATIRLAVVEIEGEDVREEIRNATDLEDVFTQEQAAAILRFVTHTEEDGEGKAP
jgi:hypothetical protein